MKSTRPSMGGNRPGLAVLTIPQEGMPQKDNVITSNLASLTFFLPGGLTKTGGGGVATTRWSNPPTRPASSIR